MTSTSIRPLDVDYKSVPRFSEAPITKIPQYVFENCNQVTCHNYSSAELAELKVKAIAMNKENWACLRPDTESEAVAAAEELDWIAGLDTLEKELLPKGKQILDALAVDKVIRYNGVFSRLCNDSPGEFRQRGVRWLKYTIDEPNELIVLGGLEAELSLAYGVDTAQNLLRRISSIENKLQPLFCEKKQLEDMISKLLTSPVNYENEEAEQFYKKNWSKINPDAVQTWIDRQGEKKDKLNFVRWLRERVHYFPAPAGLKDELRTSLRAIKKPNVHPIQKAAKIWYDIVRLHISHEANKRTGKALGSAILLAYGYLPPKIGKEDEEAYVRTLRDGFEDKNGEAQFTAFVAQMMVKTHAEYASKLNMDGSEKKPAKVKAS